MNRFPSGAGTSPENFNIGVACTDAHLGTANENKLAMIVEAVLGVSTATYRQLAQATSRFAQLLRNLGVAEGDRVLIRLPNSLAYPTAFLGAMKRGAIAVPTSTLLTAEEVVYLARDSEATVLVTDKTMWQGLRDKLDGLKHLRCVLLTGAGRLCRRVESKSAIWKASWPRSVIASRPVSRNPTTPLIWSTPPAPLVIPRAYCMRIGR